MNNGLLGQLLNAVVLLNYEETVNRDVLIARSKLQSQSIRHGLLAEEVEECESSQGVVGRVVWGILLLIPFLIYAISILYEESQPSVVIYVVLAIFNLPPFIIGIILLSTAPAARKRYVARTNMALNELRAFEEYEIKPLEIQVRVELDKVREEQEKINAFKNQTLSFLPDGYKKLYSVAYMAVIVNSGEASDLASAMKNCKRELALLERITGLEASDRKNKFVNDALLCVSRHPELIDDNIANLAKINK